MPHVQDHEQPRQIGRRAVTRAAVWSIPVVSLAVAAPAMAVSGCTPKTGLLVWKNLSSGNQLGKTLVTTVPGLTVVVSATGDTDADDNGIRSTGPIGAATSLLLLHSENNKNNTTQTITLKFSQKVQNLAFTLLDIDSSRDRNIFGQSYTNHWQDKISILPAPSSQTKGSTVQGSGTTAAPWRAVDLDTPVPDGSTTGNVQLSWSTALDTVTIVYSQDGKQDGSPKVGISDLSFQTVCP
jgi:hypothetical protein